MGIVESYVASIIDTMKKSGQIRIANKTTISGTNDISGCAISVVNEGVGRGGGVVRVEEVRRSLSKILYSVDIVETRVRIYRNTRRVDGKTYEWRVARASFSPAGLDIRDGDTVYILTAEELRRLIFMIAEYVAEKCIGEEH